MQVVKVPQSLINGDSAVHLLLPYLDEVRGMVFVFRLVNYFYRVLDPNFKKVIHLLITSN